MSFEKCCGCLFLFLFVFLFFGGDGKILEKRGHRNLHENLEEYNLFTDLRRGMKKISFFGGMTISGSRTFIECVQNCPKTDLITWGTKFLTEKERFGSHSFFPPHYFK